jgi:hypothetical protein
MAMAAAAIVYRTLRTLGSSFAHIDAVGLLMELPLVSLLLQHAVVCVMLAVQHTPQ